MAGALAQVDNATPAGGPPADTTGGGGALDDVLGGLIGGDSKDIARTLQQSEQAKVDALQQGIDQLTQRYQDQKRYDQAAGLLAAARGFLAPTRTGSFAESVGNAAGEAAPAVAQLGQRGVQQQQQLMGLRTQLAGLPEQNLLQRLSLAGTLQRDQMYGRLIKSMYDPNSPTGRSYATVDKNGNVQRIPGAYAAGPGMASGFARAVVADPNSPTKYSLVVTGPGGREVSRISGVSPSLRALGPQDANGRFIATPDQWMQAQRTADQQLHQAIEGGQADPNMSQAQVEQWKNGWIQRNLGFAPPGSIAQPPVPAVPVTGGGPPASPGGGLPPQASPGPPTPAPPPPGGGSAPPPPQVTAPGHGAAAPVGGSPYLPGHGPDVTTVSGGAPGPIQRQPGQPTQPGGSPAGTVPGMVAPTTAPSGPVNPQPLPPGVPPAATTRPVNRYMSPSDQKVYDQMGDTVQASSDTLAYIDRLKQLNTQIGQLPVLSGAAVEAMRLRNPGDARVAAIDEWDKLRSRTALSMGKGLFGARVTNIDTQLLLSMEGALNMAPEARMNLLNDLDWRVQMKRDYDNSRMTAFAEHTTPATPSDFADAWMKYHPMPAPLAPRGRHAGMGTGGGNTVPQEGTIIVNRQTGERMTLKNGRWVTVRGGY